MAVDVIEQNLDGSDLSIGVVVSRFNEYAGKELYAACLEELKRLSPDHRDVLYLYYFEGYQIAEIADILHVNKRTIGTRLARARKRLKTILEEDAI